MAEDTGIDPKDVGAAKAVAIASRVAVAQARQQAKSRQPARERGERPAGLLLTSAVVVAVLVGTLAVMLYAR